MEMAEVAKRDSFARGIRIKADTIPVGPDAASHLLNSGAADADRGIPGAMKVHSPTGEWYFVPRLPGMLPPRFSTDS
ncbi:hypothetical protein SAMN04488057_106154 [Cyclobacterium lianum]|uniref:Uncharacterized protein n=1 Tax=Cyclobacterium lianum TaxID=388280 RepID=A0A1M7NYH0_9BACT|nr:hypothetical protein SAMN04488057_106154 [Cyclobacterium lianum]